MTKRKSNTEKTSGTSTGKGKSTTTAASGPCPKKSEKEALKIANGMTKHKCNWLYGDTSMNNELWRKYLFPLSKKSLSNLQANKNLELALGQLGGS
jgi:hypothetical protein